MFTRKSYLMVLPLILIIVMACGISPSFITNVTNRETVRGSGSVSTEDRAVSGFNKVSLSGAGDVVITQGNDEALTIEAEENLLPYITTEVVGSELRIGYKDNVNVVPTKGIHFNLSVKDLNAISVAGAANVTTDAFKTDSLRLEVSGAGKVNMKGLDLSSLNVTSSGAGDFTLAGSTNSQTVTLSGAGTYRAGDLKSSSATITVTGAGNGTLWATDNLDVTISGLGKVEYYGSPSVNQQISGAGNVSGLGEHK